MFQPLAPRELVGLSFRWAAERDTVVSYYCLNLRRESLCGRDDGGRGTDRLVSKRPKLLTSAL